MQLTLRTYIALSILLTLAVSCKKDTDTPDNNNNNVIINPPAATDSSYVDKIYIIDSTAAGEDTSMLETYYYDNMKRVVTIIDTSYFSGAYLFAKKNFEYNGSDSLPFKATLYVYDGPNRDTVVSYYYFDNTDKLVKDSIIKITKTTVPYYKISHEVTTFTYAPGMMYGNKLDSTLFINGVPSTTPATVITDTATLDANGNFIHTIQHWGSNTYVVTNTFDNHPHPTRRLNIFMFRPTGIFRSRYMDPSQPNANNITHVLETATGSQNYTRDFNVLNSYYNNGFLKSVAHPETAGSPEYQKYLFVYKSL